MAVTAKMYANAMKNFAEKKMDLVSDTIKVALCASGYSVNQQTDDFWNDASGSEVASGNGYTTGGATLSNKTSAVATLTYTFDNTVDTTWSTSTITARYAVIYDSSPAGATAQPLVCYIDFGQDMSSSNGNFTISWNASGIFTATVS